MLKCTQQFLYKKTAATETSGPVELILPDEEKQHTKLSFLIICGSLIWKLLRVTEFTNELFLNSIRVSVGWRQDFKIKNNFILIWNVATYFQQNKQVLFLNKYLQHQPNISKGKILQILKKKKSVRMSSTAKHWKAKSECGTTALSPSPWRSARYRCHELSLTPLASPADASRFAAIKRCAASPSGCCCAEAHLEKRSGEAGSAAIRATRKCSLSGCAS